MIDERCLGPGVDRSKISPDAEVGGASWLTGARTRIDSGAVVRDSRVHDSVVESSATVLDSIVTAEGKPASHKCGVAGRTVISGAELPTIGAGARVTGSTLVNTSVGERSRVTDCWAHNCRLGADNTVVEAKLELSNSSAHVTVTGPTEVSAAYLGHHTVIDRRGFLEGIFSNTFRRLEFDAASGLLRVVGTIELPHLSRYGANTINSTNSGKLLPQSEGIVKGVGPHVGLWHDPLLSHEPIELGPCCWIAPWTKVIGQSPAFHKTDEELVNDDLATYIMPFAIAGLGGSATRGLVMPGELSTGLGPKQRKGGWVFTYAPGAVIAMVKRLHDALEPDRKHVADTIVIEALRTALEMTKAMAAHRGVDLSAPHTTQRRGWPRWIATTHALLSAHLEGGLWEFADGEPTGWRMDRGRWTHPEIGRLLAVAPDALDNQLSEEEIFDFDDPVPPVRVAVPAGAVGGTGGDALIAPGAEVAPDAVVGPGCRIDAGSVVESGAVIWNSVVEKAKIGAGARVERSRVSHCTIGPSAAVRSCRMTDSTLGARSKADAAAMTNSQLAPKTIVSAFADLEDVKCEYASILGGSFHSADIGVHLMSMHMAGGCAHLKAIPTSVKLDGVTVSVAAIPMLGGGSLIRGTEQGPVEMAGCFIGSNAILEPNTFVGFGSFVLGTLGPDAGILPFTLSTGAEPQYQRIGEVLTALPSTVITHFISWTYQALGPEKARAVAQMVKEAIREGIQAIRWELDRRSGRQTGAPPGAPARYRSLGLYEESRLRRGLEIYERELASGAWELAYEEGELRFASRNGRWLERGGSAFWEVKR